jgi:hypothetical protein
MEENADFLKAAVNVNGAFTRIVAGLFGGTGGDADDREGKDTPRLGLASRGVLNQKPSCAKLIPVRWRVAPVTR